VSRPRHFADVWRFELIDDAEFEAGVERAERELPLRVQASLDWTILVGER
jgi:hypothetical protein